MKLRLPPYLALLTVIGFSTNAAIASQEEASRGIGLSSFASRDSEGFTTENLAISYFPRFVSGTELSGIRYTAKRYEQDDWSGDAQQLTVIHRRIEAATWEGWQVEAGWSQQGEHDLFKLDGSFSSAIGDRRRLEFFVNRDWVETERALEDGTSFTFLGGVFEQGLGSHFTLVGVGGRQEFADGNYRNHGRVKAILQPSLHLGLTLQGRYRMYTSDGDDVGGAYFNPDRYAEAMLAFGWRHRMRGWMASATAGVGEQTIADLPRTPTRLVEVELRSPSTDRYAFSLRGGYNRSASFQGPDYVYRYLQAEWILGF